MTGVYRDIISGLQSYCIVLYCIPLYCIPLHCIVLYVMTPQVLSEHDELLVRLQKIEEFVHEVCKLIQQYHLFTITDSLAHILQVESASVFELQGGLGLVINIINDRLYQPDIRIEASRILGAAAQKYAIQYNTILTHSCIHSNRHIQDEVLFRNGVKHLLTYVCHSLVTLLLTSLTHSLDIWKHYNCIWAKSGNFCSFMLTAWFPCRPGKLQGQQRAICPRKRPPHGSHKSNRCENHHAHWRPCVGASRTAASWHTHER